MNRLYFWAALTAHTARLGHLQRSLHVQSRTLTDFYGMMGQLIHTCQLTHPYRWDGVVTSCIESLLLRYSFMTPPLPRTLPERTVKQPGTEPRVGARIKVTTSMIQKQQWQRQQNQSGRSGLFSNVWCSCRVPMSSTSFLGVSMESQRRYYNFLVATNTRHWTPKEAHM